MTYVLGLNKRPTGGGPLCVFRTELDAYRFREYDTGRSCIQYKYIIPCAVLISNDMEVWLPKATYPLPLHHLPAGTVLADAIYLFGSLGMNGLRVGE